MIELKRWPWLPYLVVVVGLLVVAYFDLLVYPEYYIAPLFAIPLLVSALTLPSRHTVIGIAFSLVVTTISYPRATIPLPIIGGNSLGIVLISILVYLLNRQRERSDYMTRQTQIENSLANQRASELHAIIDNMIDAVVVSDTQGQMTMANEAGINLLDLKKRDSNSLSAIFSTLKLRPAEDSLVDGRLNPLARAISGDMITQETDVFRSPSGKDIFLRTNAAPIRDQKGQVIGAVAVLRDVTELIEFDDMKDDFIKVAAHELKTPVAIIKGYAQLMEKMDEISPEQQHKMNKSFVNGANRITKIVEELLDISQLRLGQLEFSREPVNLTQLVKSTIEKVASNKTKHHICLDQADSANVLVDRFRIEQVIEHLLENAIKYSPNSDNVDVAVKNNNNDVVVSVSDGGVGIPNNHQAHIFERFYRAHTGTPFDYGGLGIGLYLSKEIIQKMGGHMWFESEEKKGSTFYFSLPLADKESQAKDGS
jgi:PAS domain S-box-containing protein